MTVVTFFEWLRGLLRRPATAPLGLRQLAIRRGIDVGFAVEDHLLRQSVFANAIRRDATIITAENAMKMGELVKARGTYDFTRADAIVAFARQHALAVRGHTLVWHLQQPAWLQALSPSELRQAMRDHIATMVGRYRGVVKYWDVVNEALSDSGGMRDSLWFTALGKTYIADAFRAAHAADPEALLFYNDYQVEGLGAKADAMYAMLKELRAEGVPIHGVGLQMHLPLDEPLAMSDLRTNLRRLAALGLVIHITEMDVWVPLPATQEKLQAQAAYYEAVLRTCLAEPAVKAIVFWGVSDAHSWIPGFFPKYTAALLYDEAMRPKVAYERVRSVLT